VFPPDVAMLQLENTLVSASKIKVPEAVPPSLKVALSVQITVPAFRHKPLNNSRDSRTAALRRGAGGGEHAWAGWRGTRENDTMAFYRSI
jgi:hypothetical protein